MRSLNVVVDRSRRGAIASLAALAATLSLLAAIPVAAQTDPLPSWNEGPAKQALLSSCTRPPTIEPEASTTARQRIATFDQDGTLWVEHPMYTQVVYCLDRVPARGQGRSRNWRRSSPSRPCCRATGRRSRSSRCTTRQDPGRDAHRHDGGRVPGRSEEVARDGQGSALEAALHRAHLSADARRC